MGVLRNAKHERFAQGLADGKSATEAYADAGYKSNRGNAAVLKRNQSISKRVNEILAEREAIHGQATAKAIEQAALTKRDIIAMLLQDRELARESNQSAAAIRAAELLGKELGMFVDRKRVKLTLGDLSEGDIDALLDGLDGVE